MIPEPTDVEEPTDVVVDERAAAMPPRVRIVVMAGADAGAELVLVRGTYLVGKDPYCALALRDPAVSRQHLELALVATGVRARDLGSRNGSFYQGARFAEVTVGAGAVLRVGRTELRVLADGTREALPPSTRDHFGGLLGGSLAMRELYAVLERVAPTDVAILIEGETGTGKELTAEAIHAASRRAAGPLVVCDLAGVARSLVESELFGHVRGAFTGADRDRDGAFVLAEGGTIFIDEVGELDLELQPRLLRALERRQIKPVGGSTWRTVAVRVIAATNRDLRAEVRAGRFREDLYHRLAVVRVRLPSLRERREDVPQLVSHFLSHSAGSHATAGAPAVAAGDAADATSSPPPPSDTVVPPETMALLVQHDWPGNVRELKNVLDRGLSLLGPLDEKSPGPRAITPELLGLSAAPTSIGAALPTRFHEAKERLVAAWEREFLAGLLRRARGNVSRAAREAGIDRVYLHRLLKKHGLGADDRAEAQGAGMLGG